MAKILVYFLLVIALTFSISCNREERSLYVDPETGLSFQYLPSWHFEKKTNLTTGQNEIVGNAPLEDEYFKQMGLYICDKEETELSYAVKKWWLDNDKNRMFSTEENKLYFGPIRTHRYNGVTYAANRGVFKIELTNQSVLLSYRVMALNKKGYTVLIWERSEIGGLDGFEAEGFNVVESTINIEK